MKIFSILLKKFEKNRSRKLEKNHGNELDFLIVGQGLAGTLLALELQKRGQKILVVDDGWKTSASLAAAAVLNPVTGMRITKTLGVDDLLPAAKRIYAEHEEKFGKKFFHETPFYRFYTSEFEKETKAKRAKNPEFDGWISEDVPAKTLCCGALSDSLGGFFVNKAGWLDLPNFLETTREFFRSRGEFLEENFCCEDVKISRAGTTWKDREIRRGIVFCTGFRIRENPWFGHLKWQPAKGEFAERFVKNFCHLFSPNLPLENVKILEHKAGVRPAIQGTIPKIGAHEKFSKIFLFGGFGSKGVTWIPLYAERFAEKFCFGND